MATEGGGSTEAGPGGLFEPLLEILAGFVRLLQTRLELVFTELEEERERLKEILVLGFISFLFLSLGVLLLTLLIVAIFWHSHGFYVLGGLAVLYLALAFVAGSMIRYKTTAKPRLFSASLSELAKDRERLKPSKP